MYRRRRSSTLDGDVRRRWNDARRIQIRPQLRNGRCDVVLHRAFEADLVTIQRTGHEPTDGQGDDG